jgi:hypothetical protein
MEAGLIWEFPVGILELLSVRRLGFGSGKKAKVLWTCSSSCYLGALDGTQ